MASWQKYKSVENIEFGRLGLCLLANHPQEHTMDVKCLQALRQFLYPDKTFAQYVEAVKNKYK